PGKRPAVGGGGKGRLPRVPGKDGLPSGGARQGFPRRQPGRGAEGRAVVLRAGPAHGAGTMADRELLEQQRRQFANTKTGPRKLISSLAEYIRREQRLGRLSVEVSADYVAQTLLGACWYHAYLEEYLGQESPARSDTQFARETI